jgi:protein-L-isoaspartate(D-aspartate) O-methyltransferase
MPTPEAEPLRARLAAYAAGLRAQGAIATAAVERAFATVRRDRCLTGFHTPEGLVQVPQGTPPPAEVLDQVYSDQALVTHLDECGAPTSSSSQPSLVAEMLEALELRAGLRVLEIGAGTGYNAALLATVASAPVVTVDSSRQVVAEARGALRRLGLHRQVTVVHGDGYEGWPAAAPYDRVVVTCGCTGLSPRWMAQLAGGGFALAPVAHGGVHPIMAAWDDGSAVRGRLVMAADFMVASGPLGQGQPQPLKTIPAAARFTTHQGVGSVLDWDRYADLCCFLATRDRRVTRIATLVEGIDPSQGMYALLDPGRGVAWVQMDGSVHVSGEPVLLEEAGGLLREWEALGRPRLQDWRCTFAGTGPASAPVLTPQDWSLADGAPGTRP